MHIRPVLPTFICIIMHCVLSGCMSHNTPHGPPPEKAYASARSIIDRCGKVQSSSATVVTEFIQERLLSGFARRHAPKYPVELTLVACREPLAYSIGNGKILFSTGLVQSLPNEAELAFVIAHELAHDALHHQVLLDRSLDQSAPSIVARDLELEADRLAIGIMAIAGYDPRGAMSALTLLSNPRYANTPIAGHPSTAERIELIRDEIERSGWEPPGIVNRRPYQKLRAQLAGLPTTDTAR